MSEFLIDRYEALQERFGTAGLVIGVIALILCLTGGAYAASGGLTGKQKKEVTKIAKKYAGKPGDPGALGPQGPKGEPGAKGDTGPAGKQGEPGDDGTDGLDGEDGVCSVAQPECVLPPGATLTGVYSFQQEGGFAGQIWVPISFPLRVEPLLESSPHFHYIESGQEPTDECPGNSSEPAAAPGHLCVYGELLLNATDAEDPYHAAGTAGYVWRFTPVNGAELSVGRGSWAVTAE